MKETESKAAQKKRKLSSEISIKMENEAKKRKETLLSPTSSLSPKKPVPPATAQVTPKMSSEEKNKDSFLILRLCWKKYPRVWTLIQWSMCRRPYHVLEMYAKLTLIHL